MEEQKLQEILRKRKILPRRTNASILVNFTQNNYEAISKEQPLANCVTQKETRITYQNHYPLYHNVVSNTDHRILKEPFHFFQ